MENKKYGLKWIFQKTKKCRLQMIIYMLLALFIPIIQLLFAYFMRLFIDVAVGSSEMSLFDIALYSIVAIIVGGIVIMINSILAKNIYGTNENNLRTELMEIILSRHLIDISRQHSGELLTRLTADIQAVSSCYITIAENIIGDLASALISAGLDVVTVSGALGHCNSGTTLNVYSHMFQNAQARVAQSMDGAFSFFRKIAQPKTGMSTTKSQ